MDFIANHFSRHLRHTASFMDNAEHRYQQRMSGHRLLYESKSQLLQKTLQTSVNSQSSRANSLKRRASRLASQGLHFETSVRPRHRNLLLCKHSGVVHGLLRRSKMQLDSAMTMKCLTMSERKLCQPLSTAQRRTQSGRTILYSRQSDVE